MIQREAWYQEAFGDRELQRLLEEYRRNPGPDTLGPLYRFSRRSPQYSVVRPLFDTMLEVFRKELETALPGWKTKSQHRGLSYHTYLWRDWEGTDDWMLHLMLSPILQTRLRGDPLDVRVKEAKAYLKDGRSALLISMSEMEGETVPLDTLVDHVKRWEQHVRVFDGEIREREASP